MEFVLIVGADNSGKSTLVRSLTGLGRGSHQHASGRNIAELSWVASVRPLKTFCLISSLNETPKIIPPADLEAILNQYELIGCAKAILCISTSVNSPGMTVEDYFNQLQGPNLGRHTLTHVCRLRGALSVVPSGVAVVDVPHALQTRNNVAAYVRQGIGLR